MGRRPKALASTLVLTLLAAFHVPSSTDAASAAQQHRKACRGEIAPWAAGHRSEACRKGVEEKRPAPELNDLKASWQLGWPATAYADDGGGQAAIAPPAARQEILAVLEQYRRATEARALPALAAVYVEFPPERQAAQQRYFENVRDLRVAIENVDFAVVGEEAVVSYTRTDDFADARTGRPMHISVRFTKVLRRQDGSWKITGGSERDAALRHGDQLCSET
jgi:hypothetical protein